MKYYKFLSLNLIAIINCIYFWLCFNKIDFIRREFYYEFTLLIMILFFVAEYFLKLKNNKPDEGNLTFSVFHFLLIFISFVMLIPLDYSVFYFNSLRYSPYLIILLLFMPHFYKHKDSLPVILLARTGFIGFCFGVFSLVAMVCSIPIIFYIEKDLIYLCFGLILIVFHLLKYAGIIFILLSFMPFFNKLNFKKPSELPNPTLIIGILLYFLAFSLIKI